MSEDCVVFFSFTLRSTLAASRLMYMLLLSGEYAPSPDVPSPT